MPGECPATSTARMPGATSSPGLMKLDRSASGSASFGKQLQIEFARLAHVLAALPEIELGGAEDIARIGKDRLAAVHQAADMIGMAVRDHDNVDVGRLVAGLRQAFDQPAFRQPAAQLRVVTR